MLQNLCTMFPNKWKGYYENGNEMIKIAFDHKNQEMLVVYFPLTDHESPSLVREALKMVNNAWKFLLVNRSCKCVLKQNSCGKGLLDFFSSK